MNGEWIIVQNEKDQISHVRWSLPDREGRVYNAFTYSRSNDGEDYCEKAFRSCMNLVRKGHTPYTYPPSWDFHPYEEQGFRIRLEFNPCDLWIGLFLKPEKRRFYIGFFPCLVLRVEY